MAAVLDITECARTSLPQLLGSEEKISRTVIAAGGQPCPSRPMLWPSDLEIIRGPHGEADSLTPDLELYAVHDALVGGPGAHVLSGDAYVWSVGAYPGYVRVWFENDITPEHWAVRPTATRRLERAFVITHFNHVWGHWLTEVYPKLFLIRALADLDVRAPLLLPSTAPQFIRDVVAATLPEQMVITYDPEQECFLVDSVLLPDMMNRAYIFHDSLRISLEAEAKRTSKRRRQFDEHIFISRRRLDRGYSYREMDNAKALEAEARRFGFAIVYPERLSWPDQINLFSNASIIVGEFGSGLHNAIMSGPNTRIMALNWIVDVQSRIANFRGHDIGYVLPDDGRPRGYSIGQALQRFSIDMGEFRRRLDTVLDTREALTQSRGRRPLFARR